MVLLVVLIVLTLLALAAWTFSSFMLAENQSAQFGGRRLQARAFAESGVELTRWYMIQTPDVQRTQGGHYDNATLFSNKLVAAGDGDGLERGYFTISTPSFDDDGNTSGPRYGLIDESAKLNLNALLVADNYQENGARQLLVRALTNLGMNDELADRILDYIDPDNDKRSNGAEIGDYGDGAQPKNGPLESLEELLNVPGVNWRLVFGRDLNRNGRIDSTEESLDGDFYDNEGALGRLGWSGYLTIYGAEKNLNPVGEAKIDLNNNDLQALYDQLAKVMDPAWATYIVAYRLNGPATNARGVPQKRIGGLDLTKNGRARLTTVLDVVGVQVSAQFMGEESAVLLESPFPDPSKGDLSAMTNILKLFDYAAVNTAPVITGRLNVLEAPQALLLALPGLTDDRRQTVVDLILEARKDHDPPPADSPKRSEVWLLTIGVTLDEMKQLLPFVCVCGSVYRADVLGYFEPDSGGQSTGPAVRLDVVIDATGDRPRLLFWRDISHLGTKAAMEAAQ